MMKIVRFTFKGFKRVLEQIVTNKENSDKFLTEFMDLCEQYEIPDSMKNFVALYNEQEIKGYSDIIYKMKDALYTGVSVSTSMNEEEG